MVGSGGEASGHAGGDVALAVTFFGVRGSTPCCSANVNRYGGNTSSVVIEAAGCDPLLLDLGTGVRVYGESLPKGEAYRGADWSVTCTGITCRACPFSLLPSARAAVSTSTRRRPAVA